MNMRLVWFVILFSFTFCACQNKNNNDLTDAIFNSKTASGTNNTTKPIASFEHTTFNFGEIIQGQEVSHTFKFENTGNEDLIIASAIGSCGCTVAEYPQEPIKPGKKGEINVVFNSKGKQGKQNKTITLVANTEPNNIVLTLTGNVKLPE